MKIKFKESTKDNPLLFFEDFFSVNGQFKMKKEFLSEVLPYVDPNFDTDDETIDYDVFNYNLENHVFTEYIDLWDYETETKKIESIYHTYYNHIISRLEAQAKNTNELLKQRIDGCDSPESENHVLNKVEEKANKMIAFLDSHENIPFNERLRFFVDKRLIKNIIYSKKSIKARLEPKSINITRIRKILLNLLRDLKVFESEDEISDFIELVINKNLNAEIKNSNFEITCELWVFKKIIDVINLNFNVKWKYLDIEKSKLFFDIKKNKLITQKRMADAKAKSEQKKKEKFKLINDILSEKSVF